MRGHNRRDANQEFGRVELGVGGAVLVRGGQLHRANPILSTPIDAMVPNRDCCILWWSGALAGVSSR